MKKNRITKPKVDVNHQVGYIRLPDDITAGELIELYSQLPNDFIIANPAQNVFKCIPVDKKGQPQYPIYNDYDKETFGNHDCKECNHVEVVPSNELFDLMDDEFEQYISKMPENDRNYINVSTMMFREFLAHSVAYNNQKIQLISRVEK